MNIISKIRIVVIVVIISAVCLTGCIGNFHAKIKGCVEPNQILPQVAAKKPGTIFYKVLERSPEMLKIHVVFVAKACADLTTDIEHGNDYVGFQWVEGITQDQMIKSNCDCNCQYEITFNLKEPPQNKEIRIQGIPLKQLEQLNY